MVRKLPARRRLDQRQHRDDRGSRLRRSRFVAVVEVGRATAPPAPAGRRSDAVERVAAPDRSKMTTFTDRQSRHGQPGDARGLQRQPEAERHQRRRRTPATRRSPPGPRPASAVSATRRQLEIAPELARHAEQCQRAGDDPESGPDEPGISRVVLDRQRRPASANVAAMPPTTPGPRGRRTPVGGVARTPAAPSNSCCSAAARVSEAVPAAVGAAETGDRATAHSTARASSAQTCGPLPALHRGRDPWRPRRPARRPAAAADSRR